MSVYNLFFKYVFFWGGGYCTVKPDVLRKIAKCRRNLNVIVQNVITHF